MAYRIQRPPTAFALDPTDKKQKRIEDEPHLAFIRKLPSVISGRTPCEACHIRAGNPTYRKKRTGGQQKPDDAWTLPLTAAEHRKQHDMNEMEFWKQHGIDPFAVALALHEATGDVEAGIKIIRRANRQRRASK